MGKNRRVHVRVRMLQIFQSLVGKHVQRIHETCQVTLLGPIHTGWKRKQIHLLPYGTLHLLC